MTRMKLITDQRFYTEIDNIRKFINDFQKKARIGADAVKYYNYTQALGIFTGDEYITEIVLEKGTFVDRYLHIQFEFDTIDTALSDVGYTIYKNNETTPQNPFWDVGSFTDTSAITLEPVNSNFYQQNGKIDIGPDTGTAGETYVFDVRFGSALPNGTLARLKFRIRTSAKSFKIYTYTG